MFADCRHAQMVASSKTAWSGVDSCLDDYSGDTIY